MAEQTASFLPAHNSDYLEAKYWDERFQKEEQYEWFKGYSEFRHLVLPNLDASCRVLILGCGNSSLPFDLHADGFLQLTCIDLSPALIAKMRDKAAAKGMPDIKWEVADMLALPFDSSAFDAVIEKGTMDVLFVDNDSPWEPRPEVCVRVKQMLDETHRVLTERGVFISVTFAQPHFRRRFLLAAGYSWGMQVANFGEGFHYFVYTMRKGEQQGQQADALLERSAGEGLETNAIKESPMHEHMEQEDYLMHMQLCAD